MAEQRVYEGDVGTIIKIDMQETITGATNLKLYVKKPDQSEDEWTPTIDGTDHLKYATQAGDQDQHGNFKIQPYLTLSGWTGRGTTVSHRVYKKYT